MHRGIHAVVLFPGVDGGANRGYHTTINMLTTRIGRVNGEVGLREQCGDETVNAMWLIMVAMTMAVIAPSLFRSLFLSSRLEIVRVRCNTTGVEVRRNDRTRGDGPPQMFFE